MNPFDAVFWSLAALLIVRLARTGDDRLWLPLGLLLGIALMNEIAVLNLGLGLAVGIGLASLRKHLLTWRIWAGGGLAMAAFSPYLSMASEAGDTGPEREGARIE